MWNCILFWQLISKMYQIQSFKSFWKTLYIYFVWCKARGLKFSKNFGTTLEFWVTWNKFCTENPQILGTTVYNLYGQVTCHLGFVPSWCQKYSQRLVPTYIRINLIEIDHSGVLLTISHVKMELFYILEYTTVRGNLKEDHHLMLLSSSTWTLPSLMMNDSS